jgi:hypothetical protein
MVDRKRKRSELVRWHDLSRANIDNVSSGSAGRGWPLAADGELPALRMSH